MQPPTPKEKEVRKVVKRVMERIPKVTPKARVKVPNKPHKIQTRTNPVSTVVSRGISNQNAENVSVMKRMPKVKVAVRVSQRPRLTPGAVSPAPMLQVLMMNQNHSAPTLRRRSLQLPSTMARRRFWWTPGLEVTCL